MQAVLFTNYTNEDFTGIWNKVEYPVSAGQSLMLEQGIAEKFARDLAVRECNKAGVLPDKNRIKERSDKALNMQDTVQGSSQEDLKINMDNLKTKKEMVEYAQEQGIEVDPNAKKDEVKQTIEDSFAGK